MYDPNTIAFIIHYPWKDAPSKHFPHGYRHPFITIWHVDPESDGTDDSCGWSAPKPTEEDRKLIGGLAEWDVQSERFFSSPSIQYRSVVEDPDYFYRKATMGDCLGLTIEAWKKIKTSKIGNSELTTKEMNEVFDLAVCSNDNIRSVITANEPKPAEDIVRSFLFCVLRAFNRCHRPWWRHPRWHVAHWRFQIHPWEHFKRMFERCDGCGKRFSYGYAPTLGANGTFHQDCGPIKPVAWEDVKNGRL